MLQSPENFQVKQSTIFKIINRFSRGKLERYIEEKKVLRYSPGQDTREFIVDWRDKKHNRMALVNRLIANCTQLTESRYLEIGCAGNKLFHSVMANRKLGVDPFSGGTHRMTSDKFFDSNSDTFDVVFVDGLHEYQQVWRDIKNALSVVPVGGYVGIHDMLPRNWVEAHIPCLRNGPWAGDVWKVGFDLINNPSINFSIVNIDHGVGVIKKINDDAGTKFTQSYSEETYEYFVNNRDNLPIVEFDEIAFLQ
jgi:hypothetical protein